MRRIKRECSSAVIFSKDGKIFQGMKDPKDLVWADCWHIPGGGIDSGETKEQGLIREIKEETGIDIVPYKIEMLDDAGYGESEKIINGEKVIADMHFNVFKAVIDDKNADEIEIKLDDDLVKYHWVYPSELKNNKMTPPSITLFKKLGYID